MRARVRNMVRRIHPKMRRVLGDGLIGLLVFAVLTMAITFENDAGEHAAVWMLSPGGALAATSREVSAPGDVRPTLAAESTAVLGSKPHSGALLVSFQDDRSFALILLAAVFSVLFAFNLMFLRRLHQVYVLRRPFSQRIRL